MSEEDDLPQLLGTIADGPYNWDFGEGTYLKLSCSIPRMWKQIFHTIWEYSPSADVDGDVLWVKCSKESITDDLLSRIRQAIKTTNGYYMGLERRDPGLVPNYDY